jgi:S1-C subfamily serine protease
MGRTRPSHAVRPESDDAVSDEPVSDDAEVAADGPPPAKPTKPEPTGLRRIVPKSALGLAALIFFMGIAAAFSGAVLYAYYESRQEETNNKVDAFVGGFNDQLDSAKKIVQAEGDRAKSEINDQLAELQKFAASGSTLQGLLDKAQPSVYFVNTLDQNGAPSPGTAFVVFSDSKNSYLLTSYTAVQAATQSPGPPVTLQKPGQNDLTATVFTWDPSKDLALLQVDTPNLPALAWAPADSTPKIGDRLFAISGLGSGGAAITQGFIADVSADGLQHDAPIGTQFQGGPLLNSDGEVVAVGSRTYSPLGFDPQSVFFAPVIRASCDVVLKCPNGTPQPGG